MLKEAPAGRCVYIAPLLQLAEERLAEWKGTFGKMGVAVEMLCGETATDLKLLERGTIIIATPQRCDMRSRHKPNPNPNPNPNPDPDPDPDPNPNPNPDPDPNPNPDPDPNADPEARPQR